MAKEILSGFGVDVDAVAGWLGSYGGEDSPDDISRGLFAGEVGSPRLLKLFGRLGIKTTWFIPGHSIETFPAEMKAVAEAGHEIGIHGYSHENPIAMTREQEMAVLDKCIELVTTLAGITSLITCGSATAGPRSIIRNSRPNGWCRYGAAAKPT